MIQLRPYEVEEVRPKCLTSTSVLLRRGNKIILGHRGKEGSGRERRGGSRRAGSGVGGDKRQGEVHIRSGSLMEMCSSGGWVATRQSQMPGKKEALRTQQG